MNSVVTNEITIENTEDVKSESSSSDSNEGEENKLDAELDK